MTLNDDDKLNGRLHGEQPEATKEPMGARVVYMVLIWLMLSLALPVLTLTTVVQLVIMVVDKGKPNERLSEFGTDLGVWIAKAARYQTGGSDVKPWPWTELD